MSTAVSPENLVLSREEAYYYWFHIVKGFFALVTNGSPGVVPTEAVFFPVPDYHQRFPRISFYGSKAEYWLPEEPFHAIHIVVKDDLERSAFSPSERLRWEVAVIDPKILETWTDGILFGNSLMWPVPLTWQNEVWEKCMLSWPPSRYMVAQAHRFKKGAKIPSRDVSAELGTGALWLFLGMMDRAWQAKNEPYEVRANLVESAGIHGSHTSGSIRIQTSKIGLRKATQSVMMQQIAALKKQAGRFFKKSKDEALYVEVRDFPIPRFHIPDEIDSKISAGPEWNYHAHLAKRMSYLA